MSTVKPYKPLLVITADQFSPGAGLSERQYGFALEMDLAGGHFNDASIHAFIRGNYPFLLLINRQTNLVDPYIVEVCSLCLFSKNYIRMGGLPVIAFLDADDPDEEQHSFFCEYFLSRLQAQGWPSILQWHLWPVPLYQQLEQKRNVPLLVKSVPADRDYLQHTFFSAFRYVSDYIFFRGGSVQEGVQLEHDFEIQCNAVLRENRLFEASLQEYLRAKDTANDLEVKTSVLEERLHNAEKTISVIRTKYKDDYEQLFKWYHNEYEILPLWYKRFGHILKVLMGKRTFRSLFYDHVKKYKT